MYEYKGKNVIIMLCSECNNNCRHCYVKYKGHFTKEAINSLLDSLGDKYFIILNGTEPIMFPEYYDLFKRTGRNRILTNGLALMKNEEIYEKLYQNGITEIAMSYHFGMQNNISDVKENMLDKLINKLTNYGFKVKIMTTLSTDNYMFIPSMCQKAFELGATTIKFTNYILQGNAIENGSDKVLNQEQIDYVLETIDECRKIYDIEQLRIERCGTFGSKKGKDSKYECLACNNMTVITPDLNVYQCVFDIDEGNEIGKVIDGRIMIYDRFKDVDKSYCKVLKKYNGIRRE